MVHAGNGDLPARGPQWVDDRPTAATAAVAASAVAWRSPEDYSVLSFGKDVVAAKSQDVARSNEQVIDSVLALRGFGTTDVAAALTRRGRSALRSRAGRKIAVLLSDCRADGAR